MKILICNDDGIESGGIKTLAKRLSAEHEVLVVAPNGNRSCCSHTLTLNAPITIEKIRGEDYRAYAVSGYPVDCVKVGFLFVKDFKPDVVVAGINKAHNLGTDVMYSGTVAIALEASYFGVPAFAFSSYSHEEICFTEYAGIAAKIIKKLLPYSLNARVWNVNFPKETVPVKGVRFCPLGKYVYKDRYEKTEGGYILRSSEATPDTEDELSDVRLIEQGFVTITPLNADVTDGKMLLEMLAKTAEEEFEI